MSPSGGTRALCSSVIDASCLVLEPDWPKAPVAGSLLYRPARARQSPAAALFVRSSPLENESKRGKHGLRRLKTSRFCATRGRQLVPPRSTFVIIYRFNLWSLWILAWVGS